MSRVSLTNITKSFGRVTVIPSLDLEIADKEFVVLVGPSGCGKTTTLRIIAGLEFASSGAVRIGERDVTNLPPGLRNCSMVFQNYALYPHMTVAENIGYGMRVRGTPRPEIDAAVKDAARILNLDAYLDRRPKQLSGGQRQRVAIGRAIVRHPEVFLFDEPLSNLDAKLRIEMRTEIKALHRRLATTIVYVTHDQVEAMTMADRVVVMNNGKIEQAADPITLYSEPRNLFVAAFIGAPSMNFLRGRLMRNASGLVFTTPEGSTIALPSDLARRCKSLADAHVVAGIRPEHTGPANGAADTIPLKVRAIEPLGPHTLFVGAAGVAAFTAQMSATSRAAPEEIVPVKIDANHMHIFHGETGARA